MYNFKNQLVRDLAWVIGSPPLISSDDSLYLDEDFFSGEFNKFLPRLNQLDNEPNSLVEHIQNGNTHLLGKYFESLVEFWIKESNDKDLLTHNLQVFKGRNTIGEFDFVFRDLSDKKIYHLECAGKFYLAHKNISDHSNFIGPNSIDNLERKVKKIVNEQIQLGNTNEGKEALFIEGVEGEVIPKILLKGYLFYYADYFFSNTFQLPEDSNKKHPKGWWIFVNDLDYFLSGKNNSWVIIERSNWISKVYNPDPSILHTTNQLIDKLIIYFKKNEYPFLIAEMTVNENGINTEVSRGFIVSNSWPDKSLY